MNLCYNKLDYLGGLTMGSNDSKNKFLKFFQDGKFPRFTRIGLDVGWNILLFFIVIGLVGGFAIGGVGLGYFASLVDDMPVEDEEEMKQLVFDYEETSHTYFANDVYMGKLRSDIHREETTLDKVSQHVKDAVIATEDELFYEHNGFVPKAIMRAMFQEFTNADTQSGGSTLTQQIVKNQILSSEVSFDRKAKEILIASRIEKFIEKDQILEAYLNIVPFGRDSSGRNIAGIEAAADGLFDVAPSELNLAQAAYIAGMPQNPYAYTPFLQGGEKKTEKALQDGLDRKNIVLSRMLEAGKITEEQYNEARDFDVIASLTDKKESLFSDYPYLTIEIEGRAIEKLALQLAKNDGYSKEEFYSAEEKESRTEYREQAERDLKHKGYRIHTTINKDIYEAWQNATENYGHFYPTKTVQVTNPQTGEVETREIPIETGASMIENSTGRIISFVGGRGYENDNINYAFYNTRPNGSTMKPLLGYGPAFELGVFQPGSPVPDIGFSISPPGSDPWSPSNYAGRERGIVTAREALAKSYNLPATRVMRGLLAVDNNPARYLTKLGITEPAEEQSQNHMPTVLGSFYTTVSDVTSGFTAFSNGGKRPEPFMIEKIIDQDGNPVFEHEVKETEVFSPQTAYLTLDVMRDVISNGTATYVNSRLNNTSVDWAGKTGTSQNFADAWFVGTNPNVTIGTWFGYGLYDLDASGKVTGRESNIMSLNSCPGGCSLGYSSRNTGYWSELVNAAAEVDPELVTPSKRHESPGGIVQRSYCLISGKLPSDACQALGLVQTDLFNIEHVPTEKDDSVVKGNYVKIGDNTYEAADSTPEEFTEQGYFIKPDFIEDMGPAWFQIDELSKLLPNNEAWNDLVVPESDSPKNSNPGTPSGVSMSGSTLTWNDSSNAIGYRVYMANEKGGDFKQIGSTTETSLSVPAKNRIYAVRAVNFFGKESSMSSSVIYGNVTSEEEKKKKEEEKKKKEEQKKKEEERKEKEEKKKEEEQKKEEQKKEEDKKDDEASGGDSNDSNGSDNSDSNGDKNEDNGDGGNDKKDKKDKKKDDDN